MNDRDRRIQDQDFRSNAQLDIRLSFLVHDVLGLPAGEYTIVSARVDEGADMISLHAIAPKLPAISSSERPHLVSPVYGRRQGLAGGQITTLERIDVVTSAERDARDAHIEGAHFSDAFKRSVKRIFGVGS